MSIHAVLKKYWGYPAFRPLQEDIINSILNKQDTLALLPTGGGKSICFQVPALAQKGVCIVVSPLIALMKDQVYQLKKRGISATHIISGMSKRDIDIELDNCIYGNTKFLYVSPERLGTELFQERLKQMQVSFIAVDESHCISQWGYDFRPSYIKIAAIRELLPETPVMALTASATEQVVEDIQQKLEFKKGVVFRKSFARDNLSYVVFEEENKNDRLLKIASKFKGTGVIYVRNRRKTQEVAAYLNRHNITADYYHAGLKMEERDRKQSEWINNKTRIIVATNAFGMGIDKADVRFVLHLDLPDSLEAYYQEAGRGGRDGKRAYAIVLYDNLDVQNLIEKLEKAYPPVEDIKRTYQALANYFQIAIATAKDQSFEFNIKEFCTTYNMSISVVMKSLQILSKEEYLHVSESFLNPSKLMFTTTNAVLYDFQVRNPKYDKLIKQILRSYSGCFDKYITLNEDVLAKTNATGKKQIQQQLQFLQDQNLVSYMPQTKHPKITYLTERVDAKNLRIDKQALVARKKVMQLQINSVVHYAQNTTNCRSRIILDYFNEKNTANCGTCNVCLNAKKQLSNSEIKTIENQIFDLLKSEPLTITALINRITEPESEVIEVVQWLIDKKKLVKNGKMELQII